MGRYRVSNRPLCLETQEMHKAIPSYQGEHAASCSKCILLPFCPGLPLENAFSFEPHPIKRLNWDQLAIELTYNCHQRCAACQLPKDNILDFKTIRSAVEEAYRSGIKAIRLTGGEPFLYPAIEDVLEMINRYGFYKIVNTTLLDERTIKLMARYKVDNVLIGMQAFDKTSSLRLCGTEIDLRKKIKLINILSNYVPVIRFGTIASNTLADNFERYIEIMTHAEHIESWEIYRPIGTSCDEFLLGTNGWKLIIERINHAAEMGLPIGIGNSIPLCIDSNLPVFGNYHDDGYTRIVLSPYGRYRPAYHLPLDLGATIAEAKASVYIKRLFSFGWLPKQCKGCPLKWACKAGSRSAAYHAYNDPFAQDPLLRIVNKGDM